MWSVVVAVVAVDALQELTSSVGVSNVIDRKSLIDCDSCCEPPKR
jgi:hypothetical protein